MQEGCPLNVAAVCLARPLPAFDRNFAANLAPDARPCHRRHQEREAQMIEKREFYINGPWVKPIARRRDCVRDRPVDRRTLRGDLAGRMPIRMPPSPPPRPPFRHGAPPRPSGWPMWRRSSSNLSSAVRGNGPGHEPRDGRPHRHVARISRSARALAHPELHRPRSRISNSSARLAPMRRTTVSRWSLSVSSA